MESSRLRSPVRTEGSVEGVTEEEWWGRVRKVKERRVSRGTVGRGLVRRVRVRGGE